MSDIENSNVGQMFAETPEHVSSHMHCQATVLSAYGPGGYGASWNNIHELTLNNLARYNPNWMDEFTHNTENITQDLATILELIDCVAEAVYSTQSVANYGINLKFKNGNNDIISGSVNIGTEGVFDLSRLNKLVTLNVNGNSLKFNTISSSTTGEANTITLNKNVELLVNGQKLKFNTLTADGATECKSINIPIPQTTVTVQPALASGDKIGTITVNGTTTTLYAPHVDAPSTPTIQHVNSTWAIGTHSTMTLIGNGISANDSNSDQKTNTNVGNAKYCYVFDVMTCNAGERLEYKYITTDTSDAHYSDDLNYGKYMTNFNVNNKNSIYTCPDDGFIYVYADSNSTTEHGQAYVYAKIGGGNQVVALWKSDLGKGQSTQTCMIPVKRGLEVKIFCVAAAAQCLPYAFTAKFITADKTQSNS